MTGQDPGPLVRACFHFFWKSVDSISGVGSSDFFQTGIKSIGDIVPLFVLVPRGVPLFVFVPRGFDSKVGRIIELFWAPK